MSRNQEHSGAAAEGGRPIGGAAEVPLYSLFLLILLFSYTMNIYGYSLYIPFIFHIYICPKYVPYMFLCVFRNLFSQQ